jgi:hypothetical protein
MSSALRFLARYWFPLLTASYGLVSVIAGYGVRTGMFWIGLTFVACTYVGCSLIDRSES